MSFVLTYQVSALLPPRLQFLRTLLSGGQGRIDLVEDRKTGEKFVAKTVHRDKFHYLEKSVLELPEFDHPHITHAISSNANKHNVQFILEYAPNGDVWEHLEGLKDRDRVPILRQIIGALIVCHHNGVVHGDVKLENVLLQSFKPIQVKLCDFGLSFLSHFDKHTLSGTTEFLSPEMVAGVQEGVHISFPVDLLALGIIAFEMYYGFPPFGGTGHSPDKARHERTRAAILRRIEKGTYSIPHGRYPLVEDFVRRLLVRDPTQRMSLRDCLKHPLLTPWRSGVPTLIRKANLLTTPC
jgi:serine/threonine protein kinase